MRLHRFEIHNFMGIQEATFEWDDIIVLIGQNNAGKSTVLRALDLFLGGSQVRDEALFHDIATQEAHAIELIGYFDNLNTSENESIAVRGRKNGGEWVLKKKFWREVEGGEGAEQSRWREQYYSFSSEEQFVSWPSPDNAWTNFPPPYKALIDGIPDRGTRPNPQTREILRQLVREKHPELVGHTEPNWVPNPGGGGSWKSNANSIIPRLILVNAVHDAEDEAISKEASSYGKIVSLIVEKKMMRRPEVTKLRAQIEAVLKLFRPDPGNPEAQAEEIRDLQNRINQRLGEVIQGKVSIRTSEPDIRPILLPSTTLVLKDRENSIETPVNYQGHGLQRMLIMTLLQILAEIQAEPEDDSGTAAHETRAVVLAVEEPELYMHPQMERKMRDLLYRLATHDHCQVACTTHSPVFLDMSQKHKSIVRVVKDATGQVAFSQVTAELFDGGDAQTEKDRLRLVVNFHPTVNEVFFASRVVLLEEDSARVAFETGAELTGLFQRYPDVRREVTLVDCDGKPNIPLFQKVLNHFEIPYTVVHDDDQGNPAEVKWNVEIDNLIATPHCQNKRHMISPTNLEGMLGYTAPHKQGKIYPAVKRVRELHTGGGLPKEFISAMNWVYFGQDIEPPRAVD